MPPSSSSVRTSLRDVLFCGSSSGNNGTDPLSKVTDDSEEYVTTTTTTTTTRSGTVISMKNNKNNHNTINRSHHHGDVVDVDVGGGGGGGGGGGEMRRVQSMRINNNSGNSHQKRPEIRRAESLTRTILSSCIRGNYADERRGDTSAALLHASTTTQTTTPASSLSVFPKTTSSIRRQNNKNNNNNKLRLYNSTDSSSHTTSTSTCTTSHDRLSRSQNEKSMTSPSFDSTGEYSTETPQKHNLNKQNQNHLPIHHHHNHNQEDSTHGNYLCDVIPMQRIPYIHGGYAAVAPIMLEDVKWMNILRRLMPRSYTEIKMKLNGDLANASEVTPVKIMRWAENNPVVAAFGILNGRERVDALERSVSGGNIDLSHTESNVSSIASSYVSYQTSNYTDLFLTEEHRSKSALSHNNNNNHNNVHSSVPQHFIPDSSNPLNKPKRTNPTSVTFSDSIDHQHNNNHMKQPFHSYSHTIPPQKKLPDPFETAIEWDVFLDPTLVRKVEKAMQVSAGARYPEEKIAMEIEVDLHVTRLLDRMLLAHGTISQLAAEAVGASPKLNFSRLTRSVPLSKPGRSLGGNGLFLPTWLRIFSAALKLGSGHDYCIGVNDRQMSITSHHSSATSGSAGAHHSFAPTSTDILSASTRHRQSHLQPHLQHTNTQHNNNNNNIHSNNNNDTAKYYSHDIQSVDEMTGPPPMCGLFLCIGMDDPNSTRAIHGKNNMYTSIHAIVQVLNAPLKVVLDLKSRRVPPRVWGRVIDNLRAIGISVEGIGSFDFPELRSIGACCSTPISEIGFFHSAGDLQRACHAGEIQKGDTVFFNAGSLLWQRPNLIEATCLCGGNDNVHNELGFKYVLQPYAQPRPKVKSLSENQPKPRYSTIQDYQKQYHLKIGLYVQEFSICAEALNLIVGLINKYPRVYNLGLSWGGFNGSTLLNVNGDGYWNQRLMGRNWDIDTGPTDKLTMRPEDHKIVRDVFLTDLFGQVGTANDAQEVSVAIQKGGCKGIKELANGLHKIKK